MKYLIISIFLLANISAGDYYFSGNDAERNSLTRRDIEGNGFVADDKGNVAGNTLEDRVLQAEGVEAAHVDRSSRESMFTQLMFRGFETQGTTKDSPEVAEVEEIQVPDDRKWVEATYIKYTDGTTETIIKE